MESTLWASMKSQSHCCKFQRHNFRRLQNAPDGCQPGKLQKMVESLAGKTVETKALMKVDRKASWKVEKTVETKVFLLVGKMVEMMKVATLDQSWVVQ